MNSPVEQGVLALARNPDQLEVPIETIMRKKDMLGAINLCIELSGHDDKQIYSALGIDSGHFSNIRKGKQGCNFPINKLDQLMAICGNQVPLIWLARTHGYALVQIETETQRKLREANDLLEQERLKNSVLMEALRGKP